MKTWIAVMNRCEARLYEINEKVKETHKKLKLVRRLENPKGRLKKQEINADRPGAFSGSYTYSGTSIENNQDPTERVAQLFAKSISSELDKAFNNREFDKLILVSEPNFLGKMRAELSKNTANLVSNTLNKDLIHMSDHELTQFLWPANRQQRQEVELRP